MIFKFLFFLSFIRCLANVTITLLYSVLGTIAIAAGTESEPRYSGSELNEIKF
jgi:hypothetical protein